MSMLLGEVLIEAGEITRDQLLEAMEFQKDNGGNLPEILVGLGYIDNVDLKKYIKDRARHE